MSKVKAVTAELSMNHIVTRKPVVAGKHLPRQPRRLPEPLAVDETIELLEAAGGDDPAEPDHDRRLRDRPGRRRPDRR